MGRASRRSRKNNSASNANRPNCSKNAASRLASSPNASACSKPMTTLSPASCSNLRKPVPRLVMNASRGGAPLARRFVADTKTAKLLRRARALVWRNLIRMRRVADADRRLDTRHKIQLGGLVIKAGLGDEESAVILGLLTAAKWVLSSPNAADSRRCWKEMGDKTRPHYG